MKNLKLATYSSISAAVFLFLAGVTSVLAITVPSLIFGFLVVLTFIIMLACLYHFSEKYKLFGFLGVLFATMYGVFISFNYFLQLAFMGREIPIPELLNITNPDSLFLVIELLGYFFMGLATLFMIPMFENNRWATTIKILFFVNFVLGVGGVLGYALSWPMPILIGGLILWNLIMPIAALLLFFYFKNLK